MACLRAEGQDKQASRDLASRDLTYRGQVTNKYSKVANGNKKTSKANNNLGSTSKTNISRFLQWVILGCS